MRMMMRLRKAMTTMGQCTDTSLFGTKGTGTSDKKDKMSS